MDAITINQGCSQKYVEVLGLKVLSDCDDIGVVLSIANYMKRKFETIEVKWSTMTVASIGKLLRKKGVPSTEMRGIFKDIETQICRKLYRGQVVNEEEHETLGWAELDGNLVFKADAIYTVTGKRLSTYAGSFGRIPRNSILNLKKQNSICYINIKWEGAEDYAYFISRG